MAGSTRADTEIPCVSGKCGEDLRLSIKLSLAARPTYYFTLIVDDVPTTEGLVKDPTRLTNFPPHGLGPRLLSRPYQ